MRITFKSKKRRLVVATGDDAVETPSAEWIQLDGGDFAVVSEEEVVYYEEEEEARRGFGFSPRTPRS